MIRKNNFYFLFRFAFSDTSNSVRDDASKDIPLNDMDKYSDCESRNSDPINDPKDYSWLTRASKDLLCSPRRQVSTVTDEDTDDSYRLTGRSVGRDNMETKSTLRVVSLTNSSSTGTLDNSPNTDNRIVAPNVGKVSSLVPSEMIRFHMV